MVNGRSLGGEPRGHAAGKTNRIRLVGKTKPNRMKLFFLPRAMGPGLTTR